MTKALVRLAEYTLKEFEDSEAKYCLTESSTQSFPGALYLDEPQGTTLFAFLPEFYYNITEDEVKHVCDLGHMSVYTSIGQEVGNFSWESEREPERLGA